MSKRGRQGDGDDMRMAIELLCSRPAEAGEVEALSLTPLERQVVHLKESMPPHAILMVACGYRVKFYGVDSHVASRRSGIMCIPGTPFEYSSVPYTRVDLYIHRLVAMGYHVGFADQESAAVRAAGGAKSGLFERTVSQLYSRGTLLPTEHVVTNGGGTDSGAVVGDENEEAEEDNEDAGVVATVADSSELFLAFLEASGEAKEGQESREAPPLHVVLVSFVTRRRIEAKLDSALQLEDLCQQYDIVEVVIVAPYAPSAAALTGSKEGAMLALKGRRNTQNFFAMVPEVYRRVLHSVLALHFGPTANGEEDGKTVSVSGFVYRAKGSSLDEAIMAYLTPYKLEEVYKMLCADSGAAETDFTSSSTSPALLLPGPTLRALDVFHSSIGAAGSLLHLLDHSMTACGSRRLRLWLARPLAERAAIEARLDAVAFLLHGHDGGHVEDLLRECSRLGDAEALLAKVHAQRCHVAEFVRILRAIRGMHALAKALQQDRPPRPVPAVLQRLFDGIGSEAVGLLLQENGALVRSTASTPLEFFTAKGSTAAMPTAIQKHLEEKEAAEAALQAELEVARTQMQLPGLEYRTIGGTPFILDIPVARSNQVPKEWTVLTRIKTHVRFHTPVIVREHIALCAAQERLAAAATIAWKEKQADVVQDPMFMPTVEGVIEAMASLDALRSLAVTSRKAGYVRPTFIREDEQESTLSLADARHAVLDELLPHGYVSCPVEMQLGGAWLLTGPNMGGKSALMRMIGTCVVMAQLGCYVPATSASLPVFRALHCRMGASDSILEGSSTFLSEMDETSRILRAPHLSSSLVLMDELGRGTSSFDGAAVAAATLDYLLARGATTVFVTHYSYLCDPYAAGQNPRVACYYMGYKEVEMGSEGQRIVFTYKPCPGVTPSSFGVAIAEVAGLPKPVTREARVLSGKEEKVHSVQRSVAEVARFLKI